MRAVWLVGAGGLVLAAGVLLVIGVIDDDDEASLQRLSLTADEVSSQEAGIQVREPDVIYLQTKPTQLAPGTTEVEIGTCPPGTLASGGSPPASTNGNPSAEQGFLYAQDGRSIVFTVSNDAEEPVAGQFEVTCRPDFQPDDDIRLSDAGVRLWRYVFRDLGASRSETQCGVLELVGRLGFDELNRTAQEFKDGHPRGFNTHRLTIAAVAQECNVQDHRMVDCEESRGGADRSLCREFDRISGRSSP